MNLNNLGIHLDFAYLRFAYLLGGGQQKTPQLRGFLTENNASASRSDLSEYILLKTPPFVNGVDLTGTEPANSDYLDPNVHQHQTHGIIVSKIIIYE